MKKTGISIEYVFHLVQDAIARHIQLLAADFRVFFQKFLLLRGQFIGNLNLYPDQLIAGDVLAKAADTEEEDVLEALESGRAYSSLSLSSGGGIEDGEELDPLESIGTEEHQYEVSEDRAVLAPGFRVLDERERKILHLRFFEGLTQSQIAQHVGISQMHVSRLIRRSLEKIREEIAAEERSEPKAARR